MSTRILHKAVPTLAVSERKCLSMLRPYSSSRQFAYYTRRSSIVPVTVISRNCVTSHLKTGAGADATRAGSLRPYFQTVRWNSSVKDSKETEDDIKSTKNKSNVSKEPLSSAGKSAGPVASEKAPGQIVFPTVPPGPVLPGTFSPGTSSPGTAPPSPAPPGTAPPTVNSLDTPPVTKPPVKKYRILRKTIFYTIGTLGTICGTIFLLIAAFFIYDYTTYSDAEIENTEIEIPSLALNLKRGGPKNLPILEAFLDDEDGEIRQSCSSKPKLVILGCGWGSVSLLKSIDSASYNVTVVSPTNYFLFTPMLPSATVGTLELRSLVEPIRRVCSQRNAHYLSASATKIEFSHKLVEISATDPETGEINQFYLPYDKLVVGVGSTTNTHGVKGLEYCHFLKTVQDARSIRNKVIQNLEAACLPTSTLEDRKRLLSFVICGGGPTGVELAAEIFDVLNEDLNSNYPKVIRNLVTVHVIQSRSHILNTYDQKISDYAADRFRKDSVDILTNSRVEQVQRDKVIFKQTDKDGNVILKELPFGICVWSTGVAQTKLSQDVVNSLGSTNQTNRRAIETDSHLRVLGAPLGDVYAIGDCATVRSRTAENIVNLIKQTVLGKRRYSLTGENRINDEDLKNLRITYSELEELAMAIRRRHPLAAEHFLRIRELFDMADKDKSGTLSVEELTDLMDSIDKKVTSLPATAQRAAQQGLYLGRKLNKIARNAGTLAINDIINGDVDDLLYKPFSYHHLGSLAYIPNGAVFDLNGKSYFGGIVAMYLWRGAYFAQGVSFKIRVMMFMDWLKRGIFGRDLSSI